MVISSIQIASNFTVCTITQALQGEPPAQDAACPNYHTDTQATEISTIFERLRVATTLANACDDKLATQKEAKIQLTNASAHGQLDLHSQSICDAYGQLLYTGRRKTIMTDCCEEHGMTAFAPVEREMPGIDTKSYQPLLSQQELIILNMIPPDEQIQGSQETAFNAGIFTNYLYIDQMSATAITESIIAIFDLFNAIHNFCIIATFLLHKQNLTDHEQLQQNYVKTAHLHVETTHSHQVMLSEAHMSFTDDFNLEHTNQLFTLLANCTNSITANISHCNPSYSTKPTATINYTRMKSHTCTT